jgi:hypothetical protein
MTALHRRELLRVMLGGAVVAAGEGVLVAPGTKTIQTASLHLT